MGSLDKWLLLAAGRGGDLQRPHGAALETTLVGLPPSISSTSLLASSAAESASCQPLEPLVLRPYVASEPLPIPMPCGPSSFPTSSRTAPPPQPSRLHHAGLLLAAAGRRGASQATASAAAASRVKTSAAQAASWGPGGGRADSVAPAAVGGSPGALLAASGGAHGMMGCVAAVGHVGLSSIDAGGCSSLLEYVSRRQRQQEEEEVRRHWQEQQWRRQQQQQQQQQQQPQQRHMRLRLPLPQDGSTGRGGACSPGNPLKPAEPDVALDYHHCWAPHSDDSPNGSEARDCGRRVEDVTVHRGLPRAARALGAIAAAAAATAAGPVATAPASLSPAAATAAADDGAASSYISCYSSAAASLASIGSSWHADSYSSQRLLPLLQPHLDGPVIAAPQLQCVPLQPSEEDILAAMRVLLEGCGYGSSGSSISSSSSDIDGSSRSDRDADEGAANDQQQGAGELLSQDQGNGRVSTTATATATATATDTVIRRVGDGEPAAVVAAAAAALRKAVSLPAPERQGTCVVAT